MADQMYVEKHLKSSDFISDIVIGMADGLTVPFALAAGLGGALVSNAVIINPELLLDVLLWAGVFIRPAGQSRSTINRNGSGRKKKLNDCLKGKCKRYLKFWKNRAFLLKPVKG
jgi:hypothetical protein